MHSIVMLHSADHLRAITLNYKSVFVLILHQLKPGIVCSLIIPTLQIGQEMTLSSFLYQHGTRLYKDCKNSVKFEDLGLCGRLKIHFILLKLSTRLLLLQGRLYCKDDGEFERRLLCQPIY